MSNTSIGDVEVSERTYPIIIRQYSLRQGSGGVGRHTGGEGCIRAIEFTRDVDCAILSDRRTNAPYGMKGGAPGARGKNLWIKNRNGVKSTINLGGRNQMRCLAGDMVVISECRSNHADQIPLAVVAMARSAARTTGTFSISSANPTSRTCERRAPCRSTARRNSVNSRKCVPYGRVYKRVPNACVFAVQNVLSAHHKQQRASRPV